MQFDTYTFVIFLVFVLGIYHLRPSWREKKIVLLVSSYVFYMAWSPVLVLLIWISTLVDFIIARRLWTTQSQCRRTLLLSASLVVNLGILGYFKYGEFLMQGFTGLLNSLGILYQAPEMNIILPIGISFYTFQTLSYTIDVYRRELEPSDSLLDFSLFVTFFPQLVAGPIVRAREFLPQCDGPKSLTQPQLLLGLQLFVFGLFLKTVFADSILSPVADSVFAAPAGIGAAQAWLGVFAFSIQIYCDFAAYSICAIGLAIMLGFALPVNFNSPYAAAGFSDFWKRWHITLSSWIRDYLYISLGGNEKGKVLTIRNLTVTMFLGGLWHGAGLTYIIWGLLHGLCLVVEHQLRGVRLNMPTFVKVTLTFLVVSILWIPFRSADIYGATDYFLNLWKLGNSAFQIAEFENMQAMFVIVLVLVGHYWSRDLSISDVVERITPVLQALLLALMIFFIGFYNTGDTDAFIYFQF